MTTAPSTQTVDADETLRRLARSVVFPQRSPILRTPADVGLEYEDVTFPSSDGVPLEAWYIPKAGSNKLVIANHPSGFNRYGYPSHLEPWRSFGAVGGNTFEVDYTPDYRILHDAGYHVLTYDFRNQGQSGAANGGLGGGRLLARDVIGSLQFVRSDRRTSDLTIGLFSKCQGANATIFAMDLWPEEFRHVRCMVAPQPLSAHATVGKALEGLGLTDRLGQLEQEIRLLNSLTLPEMSPIEPARSIRVPTYLYQVRDDVMTTPEDV